MYNKKAYGVLNDGREVTLYSLKNGSGMEVEVLNYGAIIRSIMVPDRAGQTVDVVMGYDSLKDQISSMGWNCGVMGRVINRIRDGKFWIDGKLYELPLPEWGGKKAPFVMHGGAGCYASKLFSEVPNPNCSPSAASSLTLYHRDLGEGGFPGAVDVWITYTLTEENELQIRYKCLPEEDTILSIASHVYFNLEGHGGGTVHKHKAKISADYYTPVAPDGLPTGEILKVDETPFDLRTPKLLQEGMESSHEQIKMQGGYDHNLCLRGGGYRECGWFHADSTGITLTLLTDMPGVHLYTSGNERFTENAKESKSYAKHGAFCLETQYFPNSTAYSHFTQPIFRAGQVCEFRTTFKFDNSNI